MEILNNGDQKQNQVDTTTNEPKTFGIVNVSEIHKSPEDKEAEPVNKLILKKWLTYAGGVTILLVLLGFWKRYFFYLTPLPVTIAYLSLKVKILAEKLERKNPI